MPRRGQQPALVHGTVDWCLPRSRYSGVGYGSAGGLAASGQRVGCHQELGGDRERIDLKLLVFYSALKQNLTLILSTSISKLD